MEKIIPVVLCFDKAYEDWACVSIYSAYLNTQRKIKFYCLVPDSDNDKLNSVKLLKEKYQLDLEIIYYDVSLFDNWRIVGHFSRITYARFLIPELINEEKIIYLDSDLLVLQGLEKLYDTDLTGHLLAGVQDAYGGEKFSPIPRNADDIYVNTGVLLMDLNSLRNDRFREKCTALYEIYKDHLKMPDQCVINKYAENRKLILDKSWNIQVPSNLVSPNAWETAKKHVSIMHFIFDVKPWMKWCNPLVFHFYWEYVEKLNLPDIRPIEITNMNQMISLANILDVNQSFEESSKLKTDLINMLIKNLSEK